MTEYMTLTDYYIEEMQTIKHDYKITLCYLLILDIVNTIACVITAFNENPLSNPVFLLTAYNSIILSYCIINKLIKLFDKVNGLNNVLLHENYRNKEDD